MFGKKERAVNVNGQNEMPIWARIAIAVITLVAVFRIFGILGEAGSSSKKPESASETQPSQEQAIEPAPDEVAPDPEPAEPTEPAKQTFDTEFGTLEYRGIQDAAGNAVVSFMYTNKSNVTISGYPENIVINNQFNVQTLGGVSSTSGIDAGNSGAFQFTFGVPTQTTLGGVSEITSISGDMRVYPKDNVTEAIGYIHFDVIM